MLIRDFLSNLRRRWYLVIAGLLVTAGLCGAAYVAVPANFETKASLLLLPPKSSVGTRGNPFLYLGGLNQALDVLSTRLNSAEITKPIADAHPGLSLEIARDATTSGPILVIDAVSTDDQATQAVVRGLVDEVPTTMQSLQDTLQIPTNSRITVMTLNVDPTPKVDLKNKLRAVIALAAVGIGGTVVLTGLIDSLLVRRRRRQATSDDGPDEATAEAETPADPRASGLREPAVGSAAGRVAAESPSTPDQATTDDDRPGRESELVSVGSRRQSREAQSPRTPSRRSSIVGRRP